VLHIIGHSHIDSAWLWSWRDGADVALNTFRSALNRMSETEGFCFSASTAAYYRYVQDADPAMFGEIRKRILEGRWEVLGGWPVEPDCNLPSAESFVRHSLYGKAYCKEALGVNVRIGFNPDSFGHAAGLPTILKHADYGYYTFMRPSALDAANFPLLFWWEGPDGSRVLASRIWLGVENGNGVGGYDDNAEAILKAADAAFPPDFNDGAFYLGVGDHGGAVTREQIRQVLAFRDRPDLPELRWSTLGQFFAAVEKSPAMKDLPVVRGELQHHSRGCYSADGDMKVLNRRAERSLTQSETITLIAQRRKASIYPASEYRDAWWKVTFNQFHDVLAGTSLYSNYQDVRDSDGSACEVAQTSKVRAVEALARRVDTSAVVLGAVFAFNSLPWNRKALVEFPTDNDPENTGNVSITHLRSKDGIEVPIQWRPADSMTQFVPRLSAWVDLPPCGYKVFEMVGGREEVAGRFPGFATISETGFGISSLKAEDGTELLSGPIGLVVIADTSDTWGHGIAQFRQEMGRPQFISSTVIERGPVTRVTRHRARWGSSEIVLDIAQFAGLDVVELRFVIDWHEHEQILKLEIPTGFAHPRSFVKVPGAIVERKLDGGEEPYQDWAAVQGGVNGNTYTVGIVNNSSYSYDCLNGLFRSILVRSAPYVRHTPTQVPYNDNNAWQDQGRQERRFWLLAGRGPYTDLSLDRRAEELQTPAEYSQDSAHSGDEKRWERAFLEVTPENVWILAVKRSENDENSTIIRMQERAGKSCTARLVGDIFGLDHKVTLAPWELKTVLVTPSASGATVREVTMLET
jgi:alpha-mannosidase